jgi:hypothetical protein
LAFGPGPVPRIGSDPLHAPYTQRTPLEPAGRINASVEQRLLKTIVWIGFLALLAAPVVALSLGLKPSDGPTLGIGIGLVESVVFFAAGVELGGRWALSLLLVSAVGIPLLVPPPDPSLSPDPGVLIAVPGLIGVIFVLAGVLARIAIGPRSRDRRES